MRILTVLLAIVLITEIQAQVKPVAIIANKPVTQNEFVRHYNYLPADKRISRPEFLEKYVDFRLKYTEAYRLKCDTVSSITKEFSKVDQQLALPYVYDTIVLNRLVLEAYQRLLYDVEASHILVSVASWASAGDTLAAWDKINKAWSELSDGKPFQQVAASYSADPQTAANGGYLGWFTAFKMTYPFENQAYQTPVQTFSKPFRTAFGYHIVKIHNKRPSRGEVRVGHIALNVRNEQLSDSVHQVAINLYNEIKNGLDFKKAFRERSDNGKNPLADWQTLWLGTNKVSGAFDSVAFSLTKVGELSKPFKSRYGWHIFKLSGTRPIGSINDRRMELLGLIEKDERGQIPRQTVIKRLKTEYSFRELNPLPAEFYAVPDSLLKSGNWTSWAPQTDTLQLPLVGFAKKQFTLADFKEYAIKNAILVRALPAKPAIDKLLNNWCDELIIQHEMSVLTQKYPKFKTDVDDSHAVILANYYTQKYIWEKAEKDSIGLNAFYETNKQKYMWEARLELYLVSGSDSILMTSAHKMISDIAAKNDSLKGVYALLQANYPQIKAERMLLDPASLPSAQGSVALSELTSYPGLWAFSYTTGLVPPMPKTLNEAYKEHLFDFKAQREKQWLEKLRNDYKVQLFPETVREQ